MADFPNPTTFSFGSGGALTSMNALTGYLGGASPSGVAWPAANRAIFVPFRTPFPVTVCKLLVGAGATATGNFDVGIYDAAGNKIVSSGATAKGANTEHILDITDTPIGEGLYYFALATDGTITMQASNALSVQGCRLAGIVEAASSYVLPSSVSYAACSSAYVPYVGAYLRTT